MACNQWFWAEDEDGDYPPFSAEFVLQKWNGSEYATIGYHYVPAYGLSLSLAEDSKYKAIPILDTSYEDEWERPDDVTFTSCRSDVTFKYERIPEAPSVSLDGVGLDHWEGNKAFLKGWVRDIATSDEICVVFLYPGHSDHNVIPSTESQYQYIYLKNASGDYDLAANKRYIPFVNPGWYGIRIIDVSGNCENWSRERDHIVFELIAEMTLIPVVSSNLEAVGWLDSTLEILFKSGWHYQYDGVPEEIFNGLMEAPSKGKYFWANIRCKCHACKECPIPYTYRRLK